MRLTGSTHFVGPYDPLAAVITDETFENISLMLLDTPGMIAPAATATKPAISAYSIKSWPRSSFKILNIIRFIPFSPCKEIPALRK
jgi:hypothetical protein